MRHARLWISLLLFTVTIGGCHCGPRFLENARVEISELIPPVSLQASTTVQAAAFFDDNHVIAAFIRDFDGDGLLTGADRSAIWSIDLDSGRWSELTDSQSSNCFLPDSGFASGTRPVIDGRILFHRVSADSDGDGLLTTADKVELWSMARDGSDQRSLIAQGNPRLADVSQQAQRILYSVRNVGLGRDFYLATASGASPVRVPIPGMVSAVFSPEGDRFVAVIEGQAGMALELVDPADNYSRRSLLEGVSLLYFAPRWSDDGTRVLAHVGVDADGDGNVALDEPGQILVVNVHTGDVESLTLAPPTGNLLGGVWAEHGRVLYLSAAPSTYEHFRGIRLMAAPLGADKASEIYCCFNSALKVYLAPSPNSRRFLIDLWSDVNNDGRITGADRSVLGLIEPK